VFSAVNRVYKVKTDFVKLAFRVAERHGLNCLQLMFNLVTRHDGVADSVKEEGGGWI